MRILIVKFGALGDVVRTSYFAKELKKKFKKLRISWITSPSAIDLLKFNPYIDDLWVDFDSCHGPLFDIIFSLDDEVEIVEEVSKLGAKKVIGASLNKITGRIEYDDRSAPWFDMGLHSKFGKEIADVIKKKNSLSHAEIFSTIFEVEYPSPEFWTAPGFNCDVDLEGRPGPFIGINPYAGGRWPSKELNAHELVKLINALFSKGGALEFKGILLLLGAGQDRERNLITAKDINHPRLLVPNTDSSIFKLADIISRLDLLITSDSLAMHLAIAQSIPFVAFFAPTSAAEIDDYGFGVKIKSTSSDYCSYSRNADNSSITARRILNAVTKLSLKGRND